MCPLRVSKLDAKKQEKERNEISLYISDINDLMGMFSPLEKLDRYSCNLQQGPSQIAENACRLAVVQSAREVAICNKKAMVNNNHVHDF